MGSDVPDNRSLYCYFIYSSRNSVLPALWDTLALVIGCHSLTEMGNRVLDLANLFRPPKYLSEPRAFQLAKNAKGLLY